MPRFAMYAALVTTQVRADYAALHASAECADAMDAGVFSTTNALEEVGDVDYSLISVARPLALLEHIDARK